jgi:hypothetical protein
MPAHLRGIVRQLIEDAKRQDTSHIEPSINALAVTGGAGGASFLDASGELWDWFALDERPSKVKDEPRRLLLALIAVESWPELAGWIPRRPANAQNCKECGGTGKITWPDPLGWQFCQACNGLGWT